ncbi:MAG: hypothetical protein Q4A78_08345 [Peptostreptococcaceae bacterium]|nr:hypothetical protein [Peptostreptococcaceae bacterium]
MKKIRKKTLTTVMLFVLTLLTLLTGCAKNSSSAPAQTLASGGTLILKVNPEIAVSYDESGKVTKINARNEDAKKILQNYSGFEGKDAKVVMVDLVKAIKDAGYFVEEIEGKNRQITIEIEKGSKLPSPVFMDDIVLGVKNYIQSSNLHSPLDVQGESDYGIASYVDTDYGPSNDGVTDYNDTDYGPNNDGVTDYNPSSKTGNTNVNDTDYGPNNDGVTDYNDTDYGPNNDGVTDYNQKNKPGNVKKTNVKDTDYGPDNDGVTDYNQKNKPANVNKTNVKDTDYGPNNDGVTDYSNNGNTNYDSNSDYGDSND